MRMTRAWRIAGCVFFLAFSAFAQKLIQPWEVPRSEETVRPNLELKEPHRFLGELRDELSAPFADSKIIMRKLDTKGKFVEYRTATTDKEGHFDLGTLETGKYRFLPAPKSRFQATEGNYVPGRSGL